jgi:DNA-binding CsgD family transcriptional regulator
MRADVKPAPQETKMKGTRIAAITREAVAAPRFIDNNRPLNDDSISRTETYPLRGEWFSACECGWRSHATPTEGLADGLARRHAARCNDTVHDGILRSICQLPAGKRLTTQEALALSLRLWKKDVWIVQEWWDDAHNMHRMGDYKMAEIRYAMMIVHISSESEEMSQETIAMEMGVVQGSVANLLKRAAKKLGLDHHGQLRALAVDGLKARMEEERKAARGRASLTLVHSIEDR